MEIHNPESDLGDMFSHFSNCLVEEHYVHAFLGGMPITCELG
jgi:hypothetical protein